MRFAAIFRCAFFAGLLSALPAAFAQVPEITLTGQPTRYPIYGKPFETMGFGNVRFGMTMAEAKARIAADYPKASSVTEGSDPVEGTKNLTAVLPELAPGPGPATINYIFGASSGKLIAIHVFWLLDGNPDDEARRRLFDVGTQLAAGLVGYDWQPLGVARGHVLGSGTVVLFSGRDERGGGVEIRLDGVAFDVERRDAQGNPQPPEHRPAPPGPARLRVSFVANVEKPDIYELPSGTFVSNAELHGFRNVRFGMTPEEVERALVAEFPGAPVSHASEADGATKLSLQVPSLEPGIGPASLQFVHSGDARLLTRMSIEWRIAQPTEEQRAAVSIAALRLINHFRENGILDVAEIAQEYSLQSNGIPLYAGGDRKGHLVQLHVGGVAVDTGTQEAKPTGPAWMLMSIAVPKSEG